MPSALCLLVISGLMPEMHQHPESLGECKAGQQVERYVWCLRVNPTYDTQSQHWAKPFEYRASTRETGRRAR